MSRVPIPSDWDGTSYCCRIIQWPNSVAWSAILFGLISWPMRGRFWDERTGTVTDAQDIGAEIYDLNITDGGCLLGCLEDLGAKLDAIAAAITGLAGANCCGSTGVGGDLGSVDEGSDPPTLGYGDSAIEYDDAGTITNRDCLVSNYIYQKVDEVIGLLDTNNVDDLTGIGLAAVITLVGAILGTATLGVAGTLLGATVGVITGIAVAVLGASISFEDMQTAWQAAEEDIVCELFSATTTEGLADNLVGLVAGLSSVEEELLKLLLPQSLLALRFFDAGDLNSELAEITPGVTCANCTDIVLVWDFLASAEGWTWEDTSINDGSSIGSWVEAHEALRCNLLTDGGASSTGTIEWTSPHLGYESTNGITTVEVTVTAPSDGLIISRRITVLYDDETSEEVTEINDDPGVITLELTESKTMEYIVIRGSRGNGPGGGDAYDMYFDIDKVELTVN
jgi:hypothetical protein